MPWRVFRNLSTADRVVRLLLGLALLALGWSGAVAGVGAIALRVFGLVPLVTGVLGWCPVYALFGVSTRRSGPVRDT